MRIGFDERELAKLVGFYHEMLTMFAPRVQVIRKNARANVWDEEEQVEEVQYKVLAFYKIDPPQQLLQKFGIQERIDAMVFFVDDVEVGDEVVLPSVQALARYEIVNVYDYGFLLNSGRRVFKVAVCKRKAFNG